MKIFLNIFSPRLRWLTTLKKIAHLSENLCSISYKNIFFLDFFKRWSTLKKIKLHFLVNFFLKWATCIVFISFLMFYSSIKFHIEVISFFIIILCYNVSWDIYRITVFFLVHLTVKFWLRFYYLTFLHLNLYSYFGFISRQHSNVLKTYLKRTCWMFWTYCKHRD